MIDVVASAAAPFGLVEGAIRAREYGIHCLVSEMRFGNADRNAVANCVITVHADLPLMLLTRALDVAMVQRATADAPQRCLDTIASAEALLDTTPCKLEGEVGRFVAARLIAP